MRKLLNTLYITNENAYLSLDGENLVCKLEDKEHDSLRFYYLGNNWEKRIEHVGAKNTYNPEGVIII